MLQHAIKRFQVKKWFTRTLWLNVHLFLALTVGLIFAVLGLTGSISVYRETIDEWLNPQLIVKNVEKEYQSLDQIMAAVRAVHPNRSGEWTLEMPLSANGMITAWFDKPRETYFERYAPLMVSVNPYTAEVMASRFWGQTFTTWILDLHTQLQYDQTGWTIVGYCGLAIILSVISGLYLWWPGTKNIMNAFNIKTSAGLIKLLLDLHRTIGIFTFTSLLLLAITGVHLSFPSVLEKLVGSSGMAHGETGRTIVSTAIPNDHPTLLEATEFIARGVFPKAELRRVTTPDGNSGVYRVNLRQKSEVNIRHPYTTVWVDRWSGQIKDVRNPAKFTKGETLLSWIWPLHTGEALGKWGRLSWFLAGQSMFFLYLSGLVRWLYKKGIVRDRQVNLWRNPITKEKLKKFVYQLLLILKIFIRYLSENCLPLGKQFIEILSKNIDRWLAFYQSKIK